MPDHKKYLWYTDTHLNLTWPFALRAMIHKINEEKPHGLFLTGDISSGKYIERHLSFLAKELKCNIYFVLGNHDYHDRTIASVHNDLERLCGQHKNLFWMTRSGIIQLNETTSLIGAEGWYDARYGNENWIKLTLDKFLTIDFQTLNLKSQLELFRKMAMESADLIAENLERALDISKTVYILTHVPPWKEATRDEGTFMEQFWLPYNTNIILGETIEKIMKGRNKHRAIVLAGHTHTKSWISVNRNIECRVNDANYSGFPGSKEKIYI